MDRRKRAVNFAIHLLIAVPLLFFFFKVFKGGYVLEGMVDRKEITLPFHYLNVRAFQAGEYPQYCRYLYSGVPVAHIAMDYAWNPLNWPLYFWGRESDVPSYITFIQIIKHALTAVFAYLFFRLVIPSRGGSFLATCAYTWSSSSVWMLITTELTTGMFFPLGMLLLLKSRLEFKPHLAVLLGVVLAIELGGGVLQWTYYMWLLWLAYAVYLSFGARKVRCWRLALPVPLLALLGASALGGLLAAPKLLPFVGALLTGEAGRGDVFSLSRAADEFGTPLMALVRVVAPNILGYLTRAPLLFAPHSHQNYVETMLVGTGFVATTLALYGLTLPQVRREAKFPLIVIGVLLAIVLLKPVAFLTSAVLGRGMIHSRWAVFLPLFIAWLAGLGMSRLDLRAYYEKWKFWLPWLALLTVTCLIIYHQARMPETKQGFEHFWESMTDRKIVRYYRRAFYWSILSMGGAAALWGGIVLLGRKRRFASGLLNAAILSVAFAELLINAGVETKTYYTFLTPKKGYYQPSGQMPDVVEQYRRSRDFVIAKYRYPIPYNPFPSSNSNIVFGLPQMGGFTNTIPKRYAECLAALAGGQESFRGVTPSNKAYLVLGVAYETVQRPDRFEFYCVAGVSPASPDGLGTRGRDARDTIDSPGRARLMSRVAVAGSAGELLDRMREMDHPESTLLLEQTDYDRLLASGDEFSALLRHGTDNPDDDLGSVSWLEERPNSFTLGVSAKRPCFLRVSSGYYRGMEATIDGQRANILRADHALMALPTPAGEHTVEFRYRNPFLHASFVLAGVGLAASLILLTAGLIRRRKSRLA